MHALEDSCDRALARRCMARISAMAPLLALVDAPHHNKMPQGIAPDVVYSDV
jgi:hypothetical protein